MTDPSYKKTLDHNYIIFPMPDEMDIDYQINMISENDIPGLIRMQPRYDQDGPQLYYEISSLQPLKRMYEHSTISDNDIRIILGSILSVYRSLRDYMLDDSHLLLMPEYIYVDAASLMPSLIFLPFYEKERNKSLLTLCEFFMSRSSHDGSDTDMLSYRLYHLIRLDNIVPSDIQKLLDEPCMSSPVHENTDLTEEALIDDISVPPDSSDDVSAANDKKRKKRTLPFIPLIPVFGGLVLFLMPSGSHNILRSGRLAGAALMITGMILFIYGLIKKEKAPSENKSCPAVEKETAQDEFDSYFTDMSPSVHEDSEECYGKTVFIESTPGCIEGILIERTKKEEYPLTSFPFTIGKLREKVDLELKDRSVSRIHARILKQDDKYYLQDCGSTNGTFINGIQLQTEETVPIEKDDEIGIGRVRFVLA